MIIEDRGRRVVVALTALSTVLLVAVVVLTVLAIRWHGQAADAKDEKAAGRAALAAARADLVDITTYSYKTIDKDFGWLSDFSDQKTAAPFEKNQKALTKVVKASRTVAKGAVSDAMSRVVSTGQVEILAFVDQVLRSDTDKGVNLEQQRVSMTMRLTGGTWKIERLDLLGGKNAS